MKTACLYLKAQQNGTNLVPALVFNQISWTITLKKIIAATPFKNMKHINPDLSQIFPVSILSCNVCLNEHLPRWASPWPRCCGLQAHFWWNVNRNNSLLMTFFPICKSAHGLHSYTTLLKKHQWLCEHGAFVLNQWRNTAVKIFWSIKNPLTQLRDLHITVQNQDIESNNLLQSVSRTL